MEANNNGKVSATGAELPKEMLTMAEAAAYTGLSVSYLYKLTHKKQIPYYKPNGKQIFFAREELIAWLKRNRQNTQAEAEAAAAAYCVGKKGGAA